MRVLLIHNPTAGDADHQREDLLAELRRHDDEVTYLSSKTRDLKKAIRESDAELVVAAGGDGTVAEVARAMVGWRDTPVLVIPAGTSNNIARSIGIHEPELDLREVRKKWVRRAVDAAMAGDEVIIEGAGCGAFAAYLHAEDTREAPSLADTIASAAPFVFRITIDGEEQSGEALMIEVMLLCRIGPNLVLAPDAEPDDGLLDVAIIREADRAAMLRYLEEHPRRPPWSPSRRATSVTLRCDAPWHLDDEPASAGARTITVRRGAWLALTPPFQVCPAT